MRIIGARVFDPGCGFVERELYTDGELVSAYPTGETVDMSGCIIIPGLTDLHFHGCAGADLSDGDPAGVAAMAEYELARGVTQICPAGMTLPPDRLVKLCEAAAAYAGAPSGAELLGVNLEGPFLSPQKMGGHKADWLMPPDIELLKRLIAASGGLVRLVTVAPELPGGIGFIREASSLVRVCIGHTAADYDTAREAFNAGAKQATHLFNAMTPFLHREPGAVGAAADDARVSAELICDGVHIHPSVVRAVFTLFGRDRVILVSDSMRGAGVGNGEFDLGGQTVSVKDGRAVLAGGALAGSASDLMACFKKAVSFGIPLEDAVYAAAVNPAKVLGAYDAYGSLDIGKKANAAVLDRELELRGVIFRGRML